MIDAVNLPSPNPGDEADCAALAMLNGNLSGTLFDLNREQLSFGRLPENDCQLLEANVSRRHFQIIRDGDSYLLKDNRSTNGTFLNNIKLEGVSPLGKGDIIRAGTALLKFIPAGDAERGIYARLKSKTIIDEQTGCFSKGYLLSVLDAMAGESAITGQLFCLLLLDIDNFAALNEVHGKAATDYVLAEISRLIPRNGTRQTDVFARHGSNNFALLLTGTPLTNAKQVAERLRKLIKEREFCYEQQRLEISLSIGIAQYSKETGSGLDLLKRTEYVLHQARKAGGDRVSLHNASSFGG
ncbi:MAG: GGDEF domain-containing protein [Gammaproteobacteria bacterium]|nr:GGDEF domain-containing protein [Gammaproteobacteria bacterium]MBU1654782.1 GGDEF domain-containing protein [Gammaproteobacteria bacterium]MBU1962655.1 GGDEF domain-containing protein [Gammaproteobacteria bacterium]